MAVQLENKAWSDSLKGKHVLLVDDNANNTFALVSYLESHEMNVHTNEDGFGAIAYLQSEKKKTDIILMDIMMPEMDGYETIRKIRENNFLRHIPVIAVTANAMKGDAEKCFEAGADDYISKPINVLELKQKMIELLTRNDNK